MRVGIHQPNFIPWFGFFRKMAQSDVFVLYDSCMADSSLNYEKRVKFRDNNNQQLWIGLPIERVHKLSNGFYPPLNEVKISEPKKNKRSIVNRIKSYYRNALFFEQNIEWVENLINNEDVYLTKYNSRIIEEIRNKLQISSRLINSSSLNLDSRGNEANIEIIKKLKGNTYISGNGAADYQDESLFVRENITITFSKLPDLEVDKQLVSSFPNSILDSILNFGIDQISYTIKE